MTSGDRREDEEEWLELMRWPRAGCEKFMTSANMSRDFCDPVDSVLGRRSISAAVTLWECPRPDGGRDPDAVELIMSGMERVLRSFLGAPDAVGLGRVLVLLLNIDGLRSV